MQTSIFAATKTNFEAGLNKKEIYSSLNACKSDDTFDCIYLDSVTYEKILDNLSEKLSKEIGNEVCFQIETNFHLE